MISNKNIANVIAYLEGIIDEGRPKDKYGEVFDYVGSHVDDAYTLGRDDGAKHGACAVAETVFEMLNLNPKEIK